MTVSISRNHFLVITLISTIVCFYSGKHLGTKEGARLGSKEAFKICTNEIAEVRKELKLLTEGQQ